MFGAILFPNISPVAFSVYGFDIYWYSFAYIIGFILGYKFIQKYSKVTNALDQKALDDLFFYAVLGIVFGARLGYMVFYDPITMINNPMQILKFREGGMSFHGGLLGAILAALYTAKKHHLRLLKITDLICTVAPIGLFLGRIANFINQEMYGRVTDVPWAVIFPAAGAEPRHPSQLYEAAMEGIALFIVMQLAFHKGAHKRIGLLTGIFLLCYGIFRFIIEFYKESEWAYNGIAAGQLLCTPMILLGVYFVFIRRA